jgi:hypothetical protein
MNKRSQQIINKKILFRLVELFLKLEKESKSPDELTHGLINREIQETKRIIGEDISNYICRNIFVHPKTKNLIFPKYQFSHKDIRFQFGLN